MCGIMEAVKMAVCGGYRSGPVNCKNQNSTGYAIGVNGAGLPGPTPALIGMFLLHMMICPFIKAPDERVSAFCVTTRSLSHTSIGDAGATRLSTALANTRLQKLE